MIGSGLLVRDDGPKRYNHFTGGGVFISTVRGGRPDKQKTSAQHPVVKRDPFVDPQASGNDDPVLQYIDPKTSEWLLQIIPNLWPLVSPEWKERFDENAVIDLGFHEVLITKDPIHTFAEFSVQYTELVLKALAERARLICNQLVSIPEISLFQCYGLQSGGSQPHPHVQVFAHRDVSPEIMLRRKMMRNFHEEHGSSLVDVVLQESELDPSLLIYRNENYAVVCSHAPAADYELQILPTYSKPATYVEKGFVAEALDKSKRKNMALALDVAARALKIVLNDPPYNILFRNLTSERERNIMPGDQHWLGWHIDVRPTYDYKPFGLQPLRGEDVISTTPEHAAQDLRDAMKHPDFSSRAVMPWQDQGAEAIEKLLD